jgi:Domain of unknown function (DUF4282)
MPGYFSFQKQITPSFVKAIYFLGFLVITLGGVTLAGWAGWRLREAAISRELGWRYVAYGVVALILGNLIWRIICEFWIVIFNLHDELVEVRHTLAGNHLYAEDSFAEVPISSEPLKVEKTLEENPIEIRRPVERPAGVLGLS